MLVVSRRLQLAHVTGITVLPALGLAAAVFLARRDGVHPVALGLAAVLFVFSTLGVEVGYHRFVSHHAFKPTPWLGALLVVAGATAAQGPAIYWAGLHRVHHATSDTDKDPHTPNADHGLFRGHIGWMFEPVSLKIFDTIPDLLRLRWMVKVDGFYYVWLLLGLALPTLVTGLVGHGWRAALDGFLWGGLVRIFVVQHGIWSINSLAHRFGSRPFRSKDKSTNIGWLSLVTMGGSLHNSHHAFPSTAKNDLEPFTIDPGYWAIAAFRALGLATDVKVPAAKTIARARRGSEVPTAQGRDRDIAPRVAFPPPETTPSGHHRASAHAPVASP